MHTFCKCQGWGKYRQSTSFATHCSPHDTGQGAWVSMLPTKTAELKSWYFHVGRKLEAQKIGTVGTNQVTRSSFPLPTKTSSFVPPSVASVPLAKLLHWYSELGGSEIKVFFAQGSNVQRYQDIIFRWLRTHEDNVILVIQAYLVAIGKGKVSIQQHSTGESS